MNRISFLAATVTLITTTVSAMAVQPAEAQNWRQLAQMVNIDARQSELERRINEAVSAGRLSDGNAAAYRSKLAQIASQEAQYRGDNGRLSLMENLRLAYDLDALSRDLEAHLGQRTTPPALTDIDARQAEISQRISEGLASGRLTAQESAELKTEFERIAAQETSLRADGNLSNSELLTLSLDLDKLSLRLETVLGERSFGDINIAERSAELRGKIADLLASGKIGTEEAKAMRQELARIAARESSLMQSGGRLTQAEKLTLALDLERLNTRIERFTPGTSTEVAGIDARQADIDKRIVDAQASGRLSATVALELKSEADRIKALESNFRSDGVLSDAETLTLARDLDSLSNRVNSLTQTSTLPGINDMQRAINKRISEAVTANRLSPAEADSLRTEFERIRARERVFRADGTLTDSETLSLSGELEDLNRRISRALSPLPKIAGKRAYFERAIADALQGGRLTQQVTASLRADLERIAQLETTMRASGQDLTDAEVLALSREYNALQTRLDSSLTASTPPPPAIDTSKVAPDTRGHWAEGYVATLSNRGVIGGFPDGSFKPNDFITRAQFAAIATRALDLPAAAYRNNFRDLPASHWGANAIASASNAGLIAGFPDGTFRPEDKITRAQALVILANALRNVQTDMSALNGYSDASTVPTWARPSVAKAATAGIIVSYPDPSVIRPDSLATRADVAALTYQTMASLGESLPTIRVGVRGATQ